MPRGTTEDNYEDSKIYKLTATGTTDCYIGSTSGSLQRRLWHHNHSAANPDTQKQTRACSLYEGGRTVAIELVEAFPCANKTELNLRERYWIENTPTAINKNIPGQSWKERAVKRDTEIKEYMTIYRAMTIECGCGKSFSRAEKARHERSAFHKAWEETQAV